MANYDLTGERFGRWSVLSRSAYQPEKYNIFWDCKCDCGKVKSVSGRSLMRGRSKSCGCSRKGVFKPKRSRSDKDEYMIGKRFGRWVVESRAEDYVTKNGRFDQWNCVCDCGTRKIVNGGNLASGKTLSCGCLKVEITKQLAKDNRLEAKYRTIYGEPRTEDILRIVLGENAENTQSNLEEAVLEMFPYYWSKKVRDEQTVIRRYGNKENTVCDMCGQKAKLDFHHIIPVSEFGGNEKTNILWVCKSCHKRIERGRLRNET